jgi:hypothetical protein
MRKAIWCSLLLMLVSPAWGAETKVLSSHDLDETIARYTDVLLNARVEVIEERSIRMGKGTEILFPSPLYGTRIGECAKGSRKDAAMSARIYKDRNGSVWLAYDEPQARMNQFGVIECGNETANVRKVLSGFASSVTSDD